MYTSVCACVLCIQYTCRDVHIVFTSARKIGVFAKKEIHLHLLTYGPIFTLFAFKVKIGVFTENGVFAP